MILFTRRSLINRASPASVWPALLLTTVRSLAPESRSASISSMGWPASPNPPIRTVEPSEMLATASAAVSTIFVISFPLLSSVFVFNHHGNTLANTDTQCSQAPTAVFSFQAARQCSQHSRTRGAQRVAQRDRATPRIHTFIIKRDAPGIQVDQNLSGKG